jgi:hypothetical protein
VEDDPAGYVNPATFYPPEDCQREKRTRVADGVYKVERLPANGADTLGLNKPPCYCAPDQCMCDHGHVPKYVYCRKAEEAPF